jgi:hypothetical protein
MKLRPSLVVSILQNGDSDEYACQVIYGTKNLKLMSRERLDLIVQSAADLRQLGLHRATRFDLDKMVTLPWSPEFFGCWACFNTPVIGSLTEDYIKEYAYMMMRRSQQ